MIINIVRKIITEGMTSYIVGKVILSNDFTIFIFNIGQLPDITRIMRTINIQIIANGNVKVITRLDCIRNIKRVVSL